MQRAYGRFKCPYHLSPGQLVGIGDRDVEYVRDPFFHVIRIHSANHDLGH
jgi:hypothetical protein